MSWRKWKIGLFAAILSTALDGLIVSLVDPDLVNSFRSRIVPICIGLTVILLKAAAMFIKDHPITEIVDNTTIFKKEDM
jgi:hypothetical protein